MNTSRFISGWRGCGGFRLPTTFLSLLFSLPVFAVQNTVPESVSKANVPSPKEVLPYTFDRPYVPPLWDYGAELGSLFKGSDNYWMGLSAGRHVGQCILVNTETCQHYVDIIGGVGGRRSYTHYSGMLSLRWQYVNFPRKWATLVRILGGGMHSIEPGDVRTRPMWGIGAGMTTFLHPKADLRLETRVGMADKEVWSQVFLSIQFRMDKVVADFVIKLKDIGIGAAEGTGSVLKTTVETTGAVLEKTATTTGDVIKAGVRETVKGTKKASDFVTGKEAPKEEAPAPKPKD